MHPASRGPNMLPGSHQAPRCFPGPAAPAGASRWAFMSACARLLGPMRVEFRAPSAPPFCDAPARPQAGPPGARHSVAAGRPLLSSSWHAQRLFVSGRGQAAPIHPSSTLSMRISRDTRSCLHRTPPAPPRRPRGCAVREAGSALQDSRERRRACAGPSHGPGPTLAPPCADVVCTPGAPLPVSGARTYFVAVGPRGAAWHCPCTRATPCTGPRPVAICHHASCQLPPAFSLKGGLLGSPPHTHATPAGPVPHRLATANRVSPF